MVETPNHATVNMYPQLDSQNLNYAGHAKMECSLELMKSTE